MKSLYSRLYRKQASPIKSQLENYITEALCDLLNRFSIDIQESFIRLLFSRNTFPDRENRVEGIVATFRNRKSRWSTQYSIRGSKSDNSRFPDLVLTSGDSPLLFVENKVDAKFTQNQLEDYGNWLAENNNAHKESALVLLTQHTEAPRDFLDPTSTVYGVRFRSICRWFDIYYWLNKNWPPKAPPDTLKEFTKSSAQALCTQERKSIDTIHIALVRDFIEFLKDPETMNIDTNATSTEIALAELGFQAIRKLESLTRSVRQYPAFEDTKLDKKEQPNLVDLRYSTIADWAWYPPAREQSWYVGWGIAFPGNSPKWVVDDLVESSAYIYVYSEDVRIPVDSAAASLPENWEKTGDSRGFRKVCPLIRLQCEQVFFSDAFASWIIAGIKEALGLLDYCNTKNK